MKRLEDILEDYSLESIQNDFQKNLKLVENFGHLIAENSFPAQIKLEGTDFRVKYSGDLKDRFLLSIRRYFRIRILIKEESLEEILFERDLVLQGRYHLKYLDQGRVEILTSSPYSKFGNIIRKISKPEDISSLDAEFVDFSIDAFLGSC